MMQSSALRTKVKGKLRDSSNTNTDCVTKKKISVFSSQHTNKPNKGVNT
jgi:hypothetical protein